jgi:hypothetical protein
MIKKIVFGVIAVVGIATIIAIYLCSNTEKPNVGVLLPNDETLTEDKNIIEVKFESSYNVAGKEIPLATDIFSPKTMLLLTDRTIAVTEKRSEYALITLRMGVDSVYLAGKSGRVGQGPGDVASSINGLQNDRHNSVKGVWLADIQSMKFYGYKADSSTLDSDRPVDVKKLPPQVLPCSKSYMLENSGILGISTAINSQVFIYSPENNTMREYNFYPLNPNPYDIFVSRSVYACYLNIKPDKSRFVLAYQWLKSLSIVSTDKPAEPVHLKFKDTPFPKFNATDQQANFKIIKNLPLQYINLYTTDNHIYALYADKKGEEMENHSNKALSNGVSIHVFNWDGMALYSLNLDRIINCFCVDEKNNVLYGIDPTKEENSTFYSFDMPDLKYLSEGKKPF